jgi:UDP-N-acetylmuramate dehydrogenase
VDTVGEAAEKINIRGLLRASEPLSGHTSFRIGGPAELYARPENEAELAALLEFAKDESMRATILGAGSNVLVSDRGLAGLVIDTSRLTAIQTSEEGLLAQAGCAADELCAAALELGLSGLEFLSGLPGTVGGAVYMNARCYEREISDALTRVNALWRGSAVSLEAARLRFSYKRSPFQPGGEYEGAVVLGAAFALVPGDRAAIRGRMEALKRDRAAKGHYLYPCAGSIFKNDHRLGAPTGALLDRLGLKGAAIGGAEIADFHANIIVNKGGAAASDVLALIRLAERRAREELGAELEREIVLMGEFE